MVVDTLTLIIIIIIIITAAISTTGELAARRAAIIEVTQREKPPLPSMLPRERTNRPTRVRVVSSITLTDLVLASECTTRSD